MFSQWPIVVLAIAVTVFANVWENRVYLAAACYGWALAWEAIGVALCLFIASPKQSHIPLADAIMIWLVFTLPIPATLIGLGTGSLHNHRWRGALIGFALSFLVMLAVFAVN